MIDPHLGGRPVTISIVSHGQWALVQPLLEQLDRWCHHHINRVILTKNIPESFALDPAWRFDIEIIENKDARGFGANHNSAFARCQTAWFLVLNPDIRLTYDVLGNILVRIDAQAGVVSPRIQEPGKPHPEDFRSLITPAELFRRKRPGYLPPATPEWIAGMFMLFSSPAFRQIKGFDERFFMYCEDCDVCVRLAIAGWPLQISKTDIVIHDAQRGSHRKLQHFLWHVGSLLKLWSRPYYWAYRLRTANRNSTDKL